jgi:hypothetical protein
MRRSTLVLYSLVALLMALAASVLLLPGVSAQVPQASPDARMADAVTSTPTPTNTPTTTPEPTPTVQSFVYLPYTMRVWPTPTPLGDPGFAYGIDAYMLVTDTNQVADSIVGMGFGWVKQFVDWSQVEPSKGTYVWGELDEVISDTNARGLRALFTVVRSPSWAAVHRYSPPADFNDFGDFVAALADRYKGRGTAYEIWNEQNLKREWMDYPIGDQSTPTGACKYVDLLKIAYARIKAADPYAMVVAGALVPTGVNSPNLALDDRLYLGQMYGCGILGWFDALGAHPSGYNNPPDADWRSWTDPAHPLFKGHPSFFFKGTMEAYREIMVANADGGRRIWITEFGWAVGATPPSGYEYAADITEAERAAWVVKAYQMSKAWGYVGVASLYNLNYRIVAPGSAAALFGILDAGYTPTLSYQALKDMPK